METWFLILLSICTVTILKALVDAFISSSKSSKLSLPPGPSVFLSTITSYTWLAKSPLELEAALRSLRSKLGPIVTVHFGSTPSIFIFSRSLAHKALVEKGAVLANRPKPGAAAKIMSANQSDVNTAGYGEKWRILRRNLASHIFHPSQISAFSFARSRVLQGLVQSLQDGRSEFEGVKVVDHVRHAMFSLLVLMCFGEMVDDEQIHLIKSVHHRSLLSFTRFQVLNFRPWITKFFFRQRWRELYKLSKDLEDTIIPLIRQRKQGTQEPRNDVVHCYVDSLLELEVPSCDDKSDVKRKMTEEEMVAACSEFLNAGTDTTTTALQWIMANLVKNKSIQSKLYDEIVSVVGPDYLQQEIKEEELGKMEYLKAVVLEGLRRHPPGHFVLPHTVTRPVELDGFMVPENAVVNFMVAEMGRDPEVWEDPMEFKPERFLGAEFDLNCSREIKMMPFGAGRRICPGMRLAMLHLEYFVANLVWQFEWKEADGYGVDLSEKDEFTVVMKNPLHARIIPRSHG